MATYKKRSTKSNQSSSQSTTKEVFETLDVTASKTERWVSKNQNYILIVVGVIALGVLGYLGNQRFILEPKEKEVVGEMGQAQYYFNMATNSVMNADSLYRLSLEGGEGKYGFLEIINRYKGTKSAKLAQFSAGIAYLRLGEYENAIRHLEKFKSKDIIFSALAKGAIADSFADLGQPQDAYAYYLEAIDVSDNEYTAPKFLFKAGLLAKELEKHEDALKFFKIIKNEYPQANEAEHIDIQIAKLETLLR
ncbi:MAG: tetratricopeptide repeat protein [Flavobacteriaceae bacterium]|nr:tetratricopeptide repeat protein [Flavobacteriaceae bacterium]MCY4266376.1 tetratricopeptide repeat protein [Flavobacteriaceae bacterium]MCY4298708.1 tetratricopeptide repeat protein [Flavobacteriaceae bacterium]